MDTSLNRNYLEGIDDSWRSDTFVMGFACNHQKL
uniref:Uncharacterized protein n=1 Tax=Rhizophora mucronata TaxID=61149 RepID=A0A2P2LX25_RHIMU